MVERRGREILLNGMPEPHSMENFIEQSPFEGTEPQKKVVRKKKIRKKKIQREKRKKRLSVFRRLYPGLLFIILVSLHVYVAIQMMVPVIVPDELGALGISAFLTGDDWSSLMSSYANYYGYGQALLAAPFFFFIRDNILLYKVVLVFYGALLSLVPVMAWYIITGIFKQPKNARAFFWSLAIGLFPCYTIYSKFAWNETLIMLLPWITLTWIFKRMLLGKELRPWLLAFLLVIGYATHGRYLGVVAAFLIMIFICQKCCRVHLVVWKKLILWMVIFLGADAGIKWALVQNLWRLSNPAEARNTLSETLGRNIMLLMTLEGWHNLFRGLNGFAFDVVAVSFGLVFCAGALFLHRRRVYALTLFYSVINKYHRHGVELSFGEDWEKPEDMVYEPPTKEDTTQEEPKKPLPVIQGLSPEAVILETIPMEEDLTQFSDEELSRTQRFKAIVKRSWLPKDKIHLLWNEVEDQEESDEVPQRDGRALGENNRQDQEEMSQNPQGEDISTDNNQEESLESVLVTDLGGSEDGSGKNHEFGDGSFIDDEKIRQRRRRMAAEFFLGGFSLLSLIFAIGIGVLFFLDDFGKKDSEYYILFGRYTEYLIAFLLLYLAVSLGRKSLPFSVMAISFLLTGVNFLLTYLWEGAQLGVKSLAGINLYVLLSYTPGFELKTTGDLLILMEICGGGALLSLILLRLNLKKVLCFLLAGAFIFSYAHTSQKEFLAMAKTQFGYVDETWKLLYQVENLSQEYPEVYLYDIQSPQIYQLPLRDFCLHRIKKEDKDFQKELKKNAFIISENPSWPKEKKGEYYRIVLPKNALSYNRGLWVYGEELHQKLLDQGVSFMEMKE